MNVQGREEKRQIMVPWPHTGSRPTAKWNISINLRGNYREINTMRYAFNIAIFHTMQCILPSLYSPKEVIKCGDKMNKIKE